MVNTLAWSYAKYTNEEVYLRRVRYEVGGSATGGSICSSYDAESAHGLNQYKLYTDYGPHKPRYGFYRSTLFGPFLNLRQHQPVPYAGIVKQRAIRF
jgi:hypothetical protein